MKGNVFTFCSLFLGANSVEICGKFGEKKVCLHKKLPPSLLLFVSWRYTSVSISRTVETSFVVGAMLYIPRFFRTK